MEFISILLVFVLACFVGYYVVWSGIPALNTPLMSGANAISSMLIVGALIAASALGSAPASASAQPEFLSVEELQNVAEERKQLRAAIRKHVRSSVLVCPLIPPEKYQKRFAQSQSQLTALVEAYQNTPCILDVTIAYQDEIDLIMMRRATVRCQISKISEERVSSVLMAAHMEQQDIRIAASRALSALDDAAEEAATGATQ